MLQQDVLTDQEEVVLAAVEGSVQLGRLVRGHAEHVVDLESVGVGNEMGHHYVREGQAVVPAHPDVRPSSVQTSDLYLHLVSTRV